MKYEFLGFPINIAYQGQRETHALVLDARTKIEGNGKKETEKTQGFQK